jgi:hypothetical protein
VRFWNEHILTPVLLAGALLVLPDGIALAIALVVALGLVGLQKKPKVLLLATV